MWSRHLSHFWLLITFLLNMLHVYQISDEYLKYDVATDVQLVFPEILEKPTVTLCFSLFRAIKWDSLQPNEWNKFSLPKHLELILRNRTVNPAEYEEAISKQFLQLVVSLHLNYFFNAKQIIEMTLSLENTLMSLITITVETIPGQEEKKQKTLYPYFWAPKFASTTDKIKSTTFLMDQDKCFSLEFVPTERYINFKKIHRSRHDGLIDLMLFKNNPVLKEVKVFISDNNHELTHGSFSSETISLNSEIPKSTRLSYDTYESRLLKYPFKTNCIEYPNDMTSDKCHHRCLKQAALQKYNIIPLTCNAYENETFKRIAKEFHPKFRKPSSHWLERSIMDQMEIICDKKCEKRECNSVIHVPRLESQAEADGQVNYTLIALHSSKTPVVRTVSQPAIHLVTYLTNLFSTFGFWMGVSVLGTIETLQQQTFKKNGSWQILKDKASSLSFKKFINILRKRRQPRIKPSVRSVGNVSLSGVTSKTTGKLLQPTRVHIIKQVHTRNK